MFREVGGAHREGGGRRRLCDDAICLEPCAAVLRNLYFTTFTRNVFAVQNEIDKKSLFSPHPKIINRLLSFRISTLQ